MWHFLLTHSHKFSPGASLSLNSASLLGLCGSFFHSVFQSKCNLYQQALLVACRCTTLWWKAKSSSDFLTLPTSIKLKVRHSSMGISPVLFWWKLGNWWKDWIYFFCNSGCQVWVLLLQLCYHLALKNSFWTFWRKDWRNKCYWRGYSSILLGLSRS